MNFKALALGAAAAALACGAARANVITYRITADANYTLAGVTRNGMIDIQGSGDTAGVTHDILAGLPGDIFEQNAVSAVTVSLGGLGLFTIGGSVGAFDLQHGTLAGFNTAAGNFIYIRAPQLDTYDMASALAPVAGTFLATGHSVTTSGGVLSINSFNNGFFSATVRAAPTASAAPEPATWAMLLAGFAGLGAVLRTRRGVAA